MSEIYIPTHLVPEEILNQLKEIAQRLHNESIPVQASLPSSSPALPSSSPTPSLSTPSLSVSSGHAHNIPISYNPPLEHVTLGEMTSAQQEVTTQQREQCLLVNDGSDVTRNSLSKQSTQSLNSTAAVTAKQMDTHKDSEAVQISTSESSSPLETNTRQNERQSQTMGPSVSPLLNSLHLQTSQQYEHCPAHGRLNLRFHPSSVSQQLPDFTPLSTSDVGRLTSHLHQPPTSVAETETNFYSSPSKVFKSLSVSDSTDDGGGTFVSSVRSQSCMSSVSQQSSRSAKEETVRVIPPRFAPSSEDVGSRNPIFLTPPETPEGERKRGVPEVFTFDDLACAQERFRQTMERLRHLQEEHTHHGSWSNSGSSSSLPVTPSYRQMDCPSSAPPFPSYRPSSSSSIPWPTSSTLSLQPRHHPRPQTHLNSKAAVASVSPLTHSQSTLPIGDTHPLKNTAEVVSSPSPPLQSPRCFQEIHHHRKKTAEKLRTPKTSVQSTVSSEQFPSHPWESLPSNLHKRWNYGTESLPYVTPDQCLLRSGSPNVFSFPDYPITESHFGRSGSENQNLLRPSEEKVDMRVLSPAHCQDMREKREECGEDSEAFVFTEPPTPYDTVQFYNRLGLQEDGQTLKKGRFDLKEDRSKEVPPCACVIMERNLLQMAESAYRWLRRQDASLADFERFRSELALTNEKLRESMDILKHIRDICDHRK